MDKTTRITLRTRSAIWVPAIIAAFLLFLFVDAVVEGTGGFMLTMGLIAALGLALDWFVLARPALILGDEELVVSNVWRTHHIPYGALEDVRVGGLTSFYARTETGEVKKITSWNAPGLDKPARGPLLGLFGATGLFSLLGRNRWAGQGAGVNHPPNTENEVERIINIRWSRPADRASRQHVDAVLSKWNIVAITVISALLLVNVAFWLR